MVNVLNNSGLDVSLQIIDKAAYKVKLASQGFPE
jgi:hypothetical protein